MSAAFAAAEEAAAEAWPGVRVDRATFDRHLASMGIAADAGPAALAGLHVADLYLACACVAGVPGALEAFEATHLRNVIAALRSVDPSPAFADEIAQRLRERLFLSQKLQTYSGRGPLASWVGIVAQRLALTSKRRETPRQRLDESAMTAILPGHGDPEVAYLKARYRAEFQEAVEKAIRVLPDRDRLLLRMALVDGVTHERIATMYSVHQTTVTRWVNAAREKISDEVRRLMQARLALDPDEVESLMKFMDSDMNLSVSRLLGEETPD